MTVGDFLRLLGDETRLRVLHLLEAEALTVAELQEVLDLGQSSISGHLAKLKQAGLIHDLPEGSARRYRLREDIDKHILKTWAAVRELSLGEPQYSDDRRRLELALQSRSLSWVERVAGSLHREYAPGRSWESFCHGLLRFAHFGRCADIGAGDGAMLGLIAPQCSTLCCIDPSPAMVVAGLERVKTLGLSHVRYLEAVAEQLPLEDQSCDAVLFLQSLQYVGDPAQALAEAVRVLAPTGRLLVVTLAQHQFPESERYGHCHRGFLSEDLKRWCRGLGELQLTTLPPETRPPRFQTLILSGVKAVRADGRAARGRS